MNFRSYFLMLFLVIFTFFYAFSFSGCYNFADDLRGSIEGRVLLKNTEIPVKDVEIHIESLRDSSYFTVYTDEDGYYYLDDVHFGVNKIEFSKDRYRSLVKYADIRADDTFELDVEIRADLPNKRIYNAVVVIDSETSQRINKAIVDVYKYIDRDPDDDVNGYWDYYTTVLTDENGFASIFLGSLARKGTIDLELRFYADGYEDKHINYTVYYETRQEIRFVDLTPL